MSSTGSNSEPLIPRIILCAGEPAGIGPDIVVDVASRKFAAELIVIADPDMLMHRAELLGKFVDLQDYEPAAAPARHKPDTLKLIPLPAPEHITPGVPDPGNANYVLESISKAAQGCLAGEFQAMVTAPVNKAVINQAGIPFTGHTEFIAAQCGDCQPVMMLLNDNLRVALVTTHLPLAQVPASLTRKHLQQVINIVNSDLHQRMGIKNPRLLVCGLNPHAGEAGYLGMEEIEVILPVIETLRSAGMAVTGPVPADTAFTPDSLKHIDAVVTMYHDQGLPVLKAQGFGEIVNVTLGLPLIRTSVDHGTALELAGSGRARSNSLQAAIQCAIDMTRTVEL
jgi:4-hydroxythreonine-4-phosphate dehydrogenase